MSASVPVVSLRRATTADFDEVFARTVRLNAHEGIPIVELELARAVRELLGNPAIGSAWLIVEGAGDGAGGAVVGYAITTYCFDLEFAGREAWLTEIWIDEPARGGGAGAAAIAALTARLRADGVRALHLQVRPDNPAVRLYERTGFAIVPRHVMTRRLV